MLDKTKLKEFIEKELADTDCFLTELSVSPDNRVTVEIDSDSSVDLDFCIALNRAIEAEFPSDEEDYELEVGSAGITSPFKLVRQYKKNIGNEVEVFATDQKKYTGILTEADDEGFTILAKLKVKQPGQKRPVTEETPLRFGYEQARKVTYLLKF